MTPNETTEAGPSPVDPIDECVRLALENALLTGAHRDECRKNEMLLSRCALLIERVRLLEIADVRAEALSLLEVMLPIDWSFVFSAPMNGAHNAARITDALDNLRRALQSPAS